MPAPSHRRSGCPVVFAVDLLGDRWTLLLIRDLGLRGLSRYGELLEAEEGISTNILADRLKRLEEENIVTKERDPDHGSKFRYSLTPKGVALIPILVEMMRWSVSHDPESAVPKEMKRRLQRESKKLTQEFMKRAKP